MMGPETIWIFIPMGGLFIAALGIWTKHKRAEMELMSRVNTESAAQYAAQNARLEQRVQTLERIITEKENSLSAEIEDLRDKPLN